MSSKIRKNNYADHPVIAEEETLLESVQETLARTSQRRFVKNYEQELMRLRDEMAEEKQLDDQAVLMDEMERVEALRARQNRFNTQEIDIDNPYFAHMRYRPEDGRPRDIMIGKSTFIEGKVRIVDWRNAPISRVFYHWRENDEFDEWIADREMSGVIESRRNLTILDGRLMRVASPQGVFFRGSDGWSHTPQAETLLQGGEGTADRPDTTGLSLGHGRDGRELRGDKYLMDIAGLLDREQFELITQPDSGIVIVEGSAGSGKTTVALHRIAYLNFLNRKRYRPHQILILMFSRALSRYISRVLPALGIRGVQVRTLQDWAAFMRRRLLPGLVTQYSDDTPTPVIRFKTHRCLIPMLEEAAARHREMKVEDLFDELLTDRSWMQAGVERHAPGAFSSNELDMIHRWCSDRHFWRVEGGGPNDEDWPTYDREDDMILLRLYQLTRGQLHINPQQPLRYDHLMIDEVQDFSPIELLVLLQTARNESVTLAGDRAQQVMEQHEFSDWREVLDILKPKNISSGVLEISYRSTAEIMAFSQHVLGSLAPEVAPKAQRSGQPVELFRCGGIGEAMTFLAESLSDLMEREPNAGVALLCRHAGQADEVYRALQHTGLPNLARIHDQEFSFGPGIEITDIAQTKGLEFDYVILLHVDRQTFPDNILSRHMLHVGASRAIHQLWLFCWREPSPLLPKDMQGRIPG